MTLLWSLLTLLCSLCKVYFTICVDLVVSYVQFTLVVVRLNTCPVFVPQIHSKMLPTHKRTTWTWCWAATQQAHIVQWSQTRVCASVVVMSAEWAAVCLLANTEASFTSALTAVYLPPPPPPGPSSTRIPGRSGPKRNPLWPRSVRLNVGSACGGFSGKTFPWRPAEIAPIINIIARNVNRLQK